MKSQAYHLGRLGLVLGAWGGLLFLSSCASLFPEDGPAGSAWNPVDPLDVPSKPRPDLGYTAETIKCVEDCTTQNDIMSVSGRVDQNQCACACIRHTSVDKSTICGDGIINGAGALTVDDFTPKGESNF